MMYDWKHELAYLSAHLDSKAQCMNRIMHSVPEHIPASADNLKKLTKQWIAIAEQIENDYAKPSKKDYRRINNPNLHGSNKHKMRRGMCKTRHGQIV